MQAKSNTRHFLVLGMIWGAALLLGTVAAWMIAQRVLHAEHGLPPDPGFERLFPLFAGETLDVPRAAGFWLLPTRQGDIVVNLGEPVGARQQVNLCVQRTLSKDDPLKIFEIVMNGAWPDLERVQDGRKAAGKKLLLNPLVMPPALQAGLPRIAISGRAADDLEAPGLMMTASGGANWRLQSDAGAAIGAPASATAATATGATDNPAPTRVAFTRDAWLLWSQPAGAGAAAQPRADAPRRFDHALHFHRVMDESVLKAQREVYRGCAAGAMSVALYTSGEQTVQPKGLGVALNIFPRAGGMVNTRLASGLHVFPSVHADVMEDQELFDAAVARGLIRLNAAGRAEVIPADFGLARKAGVGVAGWDQIDMGKKDVARLFKRLHAKRDGDFVRAQIRRFNTEKIWVALSVQSAAADGPAAGPADADALADPRLWAASADGQSVAVRAGLPDVAARLFDAPLAGWSQWLRVAIPARDRPSELVQMRLRLPRPDAAVSLSLLSLGKIVSVTGATITGSADFCRGIGCVAADVVRRTWLVSLAGAADIVVTLRPEPRFNDLHPDSQEFRHVQLRNGALVWVQAPVAAKGALAAIVSVSARDGTPLFADGQPSRQARAMGLASLLGVSAAQGNGVAGVLGRLGDHGQSRVAARLTIDPLMQRLSQQILDCVGMQGGKWQAKTGVCEFAQNMPPGPPDGRRTGLVLLDADNGEILAVAGNPLVPENATAQALINFDQFNPGNSPLRVQGLQHDGRIENSPGSSFKLVTALGLELAAAKSPALDALLDGATPGFIDGAAARQGYAFRMGDGCYPQPCSGEQESNTDIVNFRHHLPVHYLNEKGRFGLRESLAASMNTWFSWLEEMSDATLGGAGDGRAGNGSADAVPLGNTALDGARPVFAMAHRLGFERALKLDGGLLPPDFHWQAWDALRATPSQFDFILDRPQVRWHAIGSRMHVTPLQMALVAGAIGSGSVARPRLLSTLNGTRSSDAKGEQLGVRLDRIRAGMKAVTEIGTAKSAFAGPESQTLRQGVYGKTGTIPSSKGEAKSLNMGWFVGYVEPGTIAGETRRLAFAAFISRTPLTGGETAAKVVANLLESLAGQGR